MPTKSVEEDDHTRGTESESSRVLPSEVCRPWLDRVRVSPSPFPGLPVRQLQGQWGLDGDFGAHLCQNQEQKGLGERTCLSHPVDPCRCLPPRTTGDEESSRAPLHWEWVCPLPRYRSLLEPSTADLPLAFAIPAVTLPSFCSFLLLYKSHFREGSEASWGPQQPKPGCGTKTRLKGA